MKMQVETNISYFWFWCQSMERVGKWGSVVRLKFICLNPGLERLFSAISRFECRLCGKTLIAPWSYNTKQKLQLIRLYWNIRAPASRWFYYKRLLWNFKYYLVQIKKVSYWLTSKQLMSNQVSVCRDMRFLLAFP